MDASALVTCALVCIRISGAGSGLSFLGARIHVRAAPVIDFAKI